MQWMDAPLTPWVENPLLRKCTAPTELESGAWQVCIYQKPVWESSKF